ncbi:hypothetical protein F5Y16DRAFT_360500 [Xylariaceae sp. FL0255]|nr:hypothetical protein F5Y16DRAFT_360500 [Xylariaceae sp. FL0255]
MASYAAQFVGKRIFKEKVENKFGLEDVYFEQVPATRLDGKPTGKFKKVRKALPPGLSEHDSQILTKVKRRAYRLDMSFGSILGLKLGWGSIIGLVPFAGDAVDAMLALLVVRTAKEIEGGLPEAILMKMYFWILLDLVIGFVPFIGDAFDCVVLANTRNAKLLEDHLRKKGKKTLRQSGQPIPSIDPSDPQEFDQFHSTAKPASSTTNTRHTEQSRHTGIRDDEDGHTPQMTGVTSSEAPALPSRPEQATVHDDRQGKSSGGFFGFGSKKSRPADVETGLASSSGKQKRRG